MNRPVTHKGAPGVSFCDFILICCRIIDCLLSLIDHILYPLMLSAANRVSGTSGLPFFERWRNCLPLRILSPQLRSWLFAPSWLRLPWRRMKTGHFKRWLFFCLVSSYIGSCFLSSYSRLFSSIKADKHRGSDSHRCQGIAIGSDEVLYHYVDAAGDQICRPTAGHDPADTIDPLSNSPRQQTELAGCVTFPATLIAASSVRDNTEILDLPKSESRQS